MIDNVDGRLLEKLAALKGDVSNEHPLQRTSGGGTSGGMEDRLKAIEARLGSIENEQRTHMRWSVQVATGLAALIAAVALGLTTLIFATSNSVTSRVDRLDDRLSRVETSVSDLPAKLTTSLNQVNQTLMQAVTASKQTPPQVILLPAPQANQPPN